MMLTAKSENPTSLKWVKNKTLTRLLVSSLGAYFILSLPFALVIIKSEHVKFVITQTLSHWKGKTIGVSTVYVGDSITAAGRNWGRPLNTVNLAGDGYTTAQIENQLTRAALYRADNLFILAGTNDVIGHRAFDLDTFHNDFEQLLQRAMKSNMRVVVNKIPYTASEDHNLKISAANKVIQQLTTENNILCIDINPIIAPKGILLDTFSQDGIHLKAAAYYKWKSLADGSPVITAQ